MAWFKVDDKMHSSQKLMRIPRKHRLACLGLWTIAGSWSADQLTDGCIPEYMIDEWGGTKNLVDWLVKSDLWTPIEDGTQFKNWGEYNPVKADIEANREKNREKLRKWRERNSGTDESETGLHEGYEPEGNSAPDPTRPDPSTSKEVEDRPDVEELCEKLADAVEANGAKRPTKSKASYEAARLLLDRDGYTPEQVIWMINWATSHEFWRPHVLSMAKLRAKFDQMKLQAMDGKHKPAVGTFGGPIDVDAILGIDYWTCPMPPEGLTIQEELAWKKARRAEHEAERLELARKKAA